MTDRPKERVARELRRAMHEVWTEAGSPPRHEIDALAEELDLEALRSGGEERTERGHYCNVGAGCPDSRWVGGNYGSYVCRNPDHHARTPSTETDAPGEGENRKAGVKDAEDLQRLMDKRAKEELDL